MSDNSSIDYVQASVNPLGWGCFGPGGTAEHPNRCSYCYAHRQAKRNLRDCPQCQAFVPHWHPEELAKIESWKRPRRIFMESMGDLFGRAVTSQQREHILRAIYRNAQHTFMVLTKEAEHMAAVMRFWNTPPMPNLWLGVSVTNQGDADQRIPHLRNTPAAVRWVSVEPLQGPIGLSKWLPIEWSELIEDWIEAWPGKQAYQRLGPAWVVIGAETGNHKGKVTPKREWIASLVSQCESAGVPLFMKRNLQAVWQGQLIQSFPAEGSERSKQE